MSDAKIWSELPGQPEAVAQLALAVRHRDEGLHHAWLITGPPGSGRSNLAHIFAAALLCPDGGCSVCKSCTMAKAGSHPDITSLVTEKVQITIDEVRKMVADSQFGGSLGKFRVMIIEDADRMQERSSNVLLKALEEPPAGTVWLLCAPSEADMLPTIRSRVRRVGLKVPAVETVAALLEGEGIEPKLARQAAEESQSHIGMARRLANSSDARSRRRETLMIAASINSISAAMIAAERWLDVAKKDADALTQERDAEEKQAMMRSLGLGPEDTIPNNLRTDFKNLEEAQKRRATRSLRDGLDRILVDLLSLYRDVLSLQLAAATPLINRDLEKTIAEIANTTTPAQTISVIDSIAKTRHLIEANVRDLLALEGLAVAMRRRS